MKSSELITPEGNIAQYTIDNNNELNFIFSHANGFNGRVYNSLLHKISNNYSIHTYDMRGHGDTTLKANPNNLKSWYSFRDDLLSVIENFKTPVVLSGHSMGATASLLVALHKPELVKKLILIEPVILPLKYIISYRLLQFLKLAHFVSPLARNASIRRNGWDTKEEAIEYFRGKKLFSKTSDEVLTNYVEYGLKKESQYKLKCNPAWESACFRLTSHEVWFDLKYIDIPIKIILTPGSLVCNNISQSRIKKYIPHSEICFIDQSSHMLPLEKIDEVSAEINNFLE